MALATLFFLLRCLIINSASAALLPSSKTLPDHLLKQLIQASHHRTVLSPAPTGLACTLEQQRTKMYFIKGIFQPQKREGGVKRGSNLNLGLAFLQDSTFLRP
jgi:hypothetical protein